MTENLIVKEENFKYIGKILMANADRTLALAHCMCLMQSNPADIIKREYTVNGKRWFVYHGPTFKMTLDEDHTYHCFFNKLTGMNIRFGKTLDDDPDWCELGPEILDLEVSVNGCVPIPGSVNCRYCYKNNTSITPTNMAFETFKQIISTFPINLSQIAFGITGLKTNPDLPKMFEYCRMIGIIPNITTVGADLDNDMKDMICKYAGACAVSCYTGAKDHCYKTIKLLHDYALEKYARDIHVNMHVVLSKDNLNFILDVLNDIRNKKVEGLKSIVLLRIKPKGRAANMNCLLEKNDYKTIIDFCIDNNISFGFDSCSAQVVSDILKEIGKTNLTNCCEPCESSKFSAYINVKGEYWSCSFAEGTNNVFPIDTAKYTSSIEWWNKNYKKCVDFLWKSPACRSCPIYNLDC